MDIKDERIDGGNAFDWGRTSHDYARYRDIYPREFYEKIAKRGLCVSGQNVLDVGTGAGVLPRNMYSLGAHWTGTDVSEKQIEQAKALSEGMNIDYCVSSAENIDFPDRSFDVITACQCIWYFRHELTASKFHRLLKNDGRLLVLVMEWLPFEDKIADASEKLVLKYSPQWSGAGERMHPIQIPECYTELFDVVFRDEYKLGVHFTRESWNGRMKACRGIGASLPQEKIDEWEAEHMEMLSKLAPQEFEVTHYAAMAELSKKDI